MTSHRDFRRLPTTVFTVFVVGIARMIKCPKAVPIMLAQLHPSLLSNFFLLIRFKSQNLGNLSRSKADLQFYPGVNIVYFIYFFLSRSEFRV